ncbi:ATP-dependent zinc protease [Pseudaeromonas sp. ZJS20]|uniref:ATP-dependent zinc protease family protein n=1 Tax=Pseudaeromonas aegiceratis TaxID=3153928 RepID=UPI00390C6947
MTLSLTGCANLTNQAVTEVKADIKRSEQQLGSQMTQGQQQQQQQQANTQAQLDRLLAQQKDNEVLIGSLLSQQQSLNQMVKAMSRPATSQQSPVKFSDPGLTTPDGKLILGESEWVYVAEAHGTFQSRVDTGAATSSISATDIQVFERDGHRWVKFKMPLDEGGTLDMEAPFVRYVRIRQSSSDHYDRRPSVRLSIQLGSLKEQAEFNLKDRSQMDFSLLLGRELIKDVAVVDVAREFVQPKPEADGATEVTAKSRKTEAPQPTPATKVSDPVSAAAPVVKAPAKSEAQPAEPKPESKPASAASQS